MGRWTPLPLLILLGYGIAFAATAFGRSLPAFDDHPGQFYRLWHMITHGPAPWAWNAGWWAGYPELQFYPPGYFYVGMLLHHASLGLVSIAATYQTLLWVTWLAPGLTVYAALTRLLGNGWLALPGAFMALTLSGGWASGVEGGIHIGMLPARLAWALLPLLLIAVARWTSRPAAREWPLAAVAPLLATIVLTHPAHAPVALGLLLAGAWLRPERRAARLAGAALALVLGALLSAFWTVPLLLRLEHTRALAWGRLEPPVDPLPFALLALSALAYRLCPRTRPETVALALWPWIAAAVVALDALILEPLDVRWLPADRVADGASMAVLLAAGFATGRLLERLTARAGVPVAIPVLAAIALAVVLSLPGRALALWPRAADWPSYATTAQGLRLEDLWSALRGAPAGRVLFVRSSVPLVFGADWWRPHTHVTALAPLFAGREIINGTFTHPSPIASLVYRGSPARGAVTTLVERLDGRSLFGRSLEDLDATTLEAKAARLGVSVIVALDEDVPKLHALNDGTAFGRRAAIGPFVIYERRTPVEPPAWVDAHRLRVNLPGAPGAWAPAGIAYYPLWRAQRDGTRLPTRRGPAWDLEVKIDERTGPVDLVYDTAGVETGMAIVSAVFLLAWVGWCWRAGRAPAP